MAAHRNVLPAALLWLFTWPGGCRDAPCFATHMQTCAFYPLRFFLRADDGGRAMTRRHTDIQQHTIGNKTSETMMEGDGNGVRSTSMSTEYSTVFQHKHKLSYEMKQSGRKSIPSLFAFKFVIALLACWLLPSNLLVVTAKKVSVPPSEKDPVHLTLINDSPCMLEVFWVNPANGDTTKMSSPRLEPGGSLPLNSYEGHKFEVHNVLSKCCGSTKDNCNRMNSFVMTSQPKQVMRVKDGLEFVLEEGHDGGDGSTLVRKTEANGLTRHARTNQRTLVNLHDLDLEANKELDLGVDDPAEAARQVMNRIGATLHKRMTKVFEKAKTRECRALIGEHFGYFVNALGTEHSIPFADVSFENQCNETKYDLDNLPEGMHFGHIQNRTYQPPRDEAEYIDDPANLKLCYAVLTHDDAAATIRLIEALYEEGHVFVVHVDGKESSDEVQETLTKYAASRDHVHVLQQPYRVRVNWGGFSMVNATLQAFKYAFAVDQAHSEPLDFHKMVHIAASSYPIASNTEIRRRIASYPLDANMMNVIMKPSKIHPHNWHYFVECDDAVHRIYRLEPMTEKQGSIDLYTSSQWFIFSREFTKYIAEARPGTLVHDYLEYVQHVVVADETFFGTVLRNTPFCHKHHNTNFLHLQFDRWESELEQGKRDERKCLMPSPDHCGRSPTTMTVDYIDVLELSEDLFARKFSDSADSKIKDYLDIHRAKEEEQLKSGTDLPLNVKGPESGFTEHGVMILAKETVQNDKPLCLGLGDTGNKLRLVPCFHSWVPSTLAPGWETGAVIEEETLLHNRWEIGPCSSDGSLERTPTGQMNMTEGIFSPIGPRCMLKQVDGMRAGRCLDGESERTQPGGDLQVFPCIRRWHQFVSFGNGNMTPAGSMHTTIPRYIVKRIVESGKDQEPYLCLGVHGRGDRDEEEWEEDKKKNLGNKKSKPVTTKAADELPPLSEWEGEQVVTTRCSNVDAVIEWLYVPYILEEEDIEESPSDATSTVDEDKEL